MDKIYLQGMAFYGYHGVYSEENKLGQRFLVDLTLDVDLTKAGEEDDIQQTVHYAKAYNIVRSVVEGSHMKLIEAVTQKIIHDVLQAFPIVARCTVKVTKPHPPIQGYYDAVAVEMTREQLS